MADLALKTFTPSKILWLDLEMTGLDPAKDRILEVGAIMTDWEFNELATLESGVGQNEAEIKPLLDVNEMYSAMPQNKTAMLDLARKSPSEPEVESRVVAMVDKFAAPSELVLLAGNSISFDRSFIRKWWPNLDARLHYRMLDVTAWKVVMLGKYDIQYPKQETHRALDDIQESIAELKFYLSRAKF